MMKKLLAVVLGLGMLCAIGANAATMSKKKLQIFILAGQSNMVGHAHYITIPALLTEEKPGVEEPGVKELVNVIFKEGAITAADVTNYVHIGLECERLEADLRTNKTAAAEAELKQLQT